MIYLSKGGGGGADSDHTWIRPWLTDNSDWAHVQFWSEEPDVLYIVHY